MVVKKKKVAAKKATADAEPKSSVVPAVQRWNVPDQACLTKLRLRMEHDDPHFPGMKKLRIRGKDLIKLPKELFLLNELAILELTPERIASLDYTLKYLPPDIGRLIFLRVLILDTNDLQELPPEVGRLAHIQRLSVSNNKLFSLPDMSAMRSLQSLQAASNQIDKFPLSLCKLRQLQFVDFSGNKITDLPTSIGRMPALSTLLVYHNELTKLPPGLCRLDKLRSLWLGDNQIRRLPRQFGNLASLDWGLNGTPIQSVCFEGNPLTYPPLEVCRKGMESIKEYLATQKPPRNAQSPGRSPRRPGVTSRLSPSPRPAVAKKTPRTGVNDTPADSGRGKQPPQAKGTPRNQQKKTVAK